MKSELGDRQRLLHIREAIEQIRQYTSNVTEDEFTDNSMMLFACVKQLEIVGEAASKLSRDIRARVPGIPWREVIGFRNIMVHEYFDIDANIVWQIIDKDLQDLYDQMNKLLSLPTIDQTNFNFPKQSNVYHGKVREVYSIGNDLLVMIASDRISAFDVVLPRQIPFKGQVLNQVASHFLELTKDIIPNWRIASPDPNVTIGYRCEPLKVEMVIRGYLTGHAWRTYKSGLRMLCGVALPDGLKEHDKLPHPIITPSTKASEGHDEDISREEIIAQKIVNEDTYAKMEFATHRLFRRGTELARQQGLILVDTKYEFGLRNGALMLMDEIHTPDSSRYFYADGYEARQKKGEQQKQLSKEFVREWLIAGGFMGKAGQQIPTMTDDFVNLVSARYIELFEKVTGKKFEPDTSENPLERIERNVLNYLSDL